MQEQTKGLASRRLPDCQAPEGHPAVRNSSSSRGAYMLPALLYISPGSFLACWFARRHACYPQFATSWPCSCPSGDQTHPMILPPRLYPVLPSDKRSWVPHLELAALSKIPILSTESPTASKKESRAIISHTAPDCPGKATAISRLTSWYMACSDSSFRLLLAFSYALYRSTWFCVPNLLFSSCVSSYTELCLSASHRICPAPPSELARRWYSLLRSFQAH